MKTLTMILAAALTLQVGVLFAGNMNERVPAARENTPMITVSLIPEIPAVATFEEMLVTDLYTSFVPSYPMAADFNETEVDLIFVPGLAPAIPMVADFNDTPETVNPDYSNLAPTTPAVADFE
jgi:hypothetical protein